MANSITLAKNYIANLDEVYKLASTTTDLNSPAEIVRQGANAKEILVPKMSMTGLRNYNRGTGYQSGDVTLEWETLTFNYDRGLKFQVDTMDDEETINLAFGQLGAEFMRTQVAPEADAFTYATLAGTSGVQDAASGGDLFQRRTSAGRFGGRYDRYGRSRSPRHRALSQDHPHSVPSGAECQEQHQRRYS